MSETSNNDAGASGPHNIELEQQLLGTLLMRSEYFDRVASMLRPEHFFDPIHQRLFTLCHAIFEQHRPVSAMTVSAFVSEDESRSWEDIGGRSYVTRLLSFPAPDEYILDHATQLIDYWRRREMLAMMTEAYPAINEMSSSFDAVSDMIEETAAGLRQEGKRLRTVMRIGEAVKQVVTHIDTPSDDRNALNGLSTGLRDVDAKLGGLAPGDMIVIAGRPSMGKAQPMNAKILLADGSWKNMGDIRIGDELASIDGLSSMVSGIYPQGNKEIYRVTFSDGRSTECCADHLWSVHHRKWAIPKVLSTTDVMALMEKPSAHLRYWVESCSGHFGNANPLPINPWVLGVLLGDGCITRNRVQLTSADDEIVEGMKNAVGGDLVLTQQGRMGYRITTYQKNCINCGLPLEFLRGGKVYCDYRCANSANYKRRADEGAAYASRVKRAGSRSNPLMDQIKLLGLSGCNSKTKFVPEIYKAASRDDRIALLRGLLDTDGWIEKFGCVRFCTVSKRLADDVVYLARSIGAWASTKPKDTIFTNNGERKHGLPAWVITIAYDNANELFTVHKKLERALIPRQRKKRACFSKIEPVDIRTAQCITVTHPSHLYITNDFIVTHNSSLALDIARTTAMAGKGVLYISPEMTAREFGFRVLSDDVFDAGERIEYASIRRRWLDDHQKAMLRAAAARADGWPLLIEEAGDITIGGIRSLAKKAQRQFERDGTPLSLLVVDHIGLVSVPSARGEFERVSYISAQMKALAKTFCVPVIALSQLSRQVESREDKRPMLSDLRQSGSIEQDADIVMFPYRHEYYLERSKPESFTSVNAEADWQTEFSKHKNRADIIIAKNRNGPIGSVKAFCDVAVNAFRDIQNEV